MINDNEPTTSGIDLRPYKPLENKHTPEADKGIPLEEVLKRGYKSRLNNIGGYEVDKTLSGKRAQVYHNKELNKTIVNHTGTNSANDWITDLKFGLGLEKSTTRYKHAKNIQQQAEKKYSNSNLITSGHSLGGALAKTTSTKGKIITLNSATRPQDMFKKVPDKQTNIRSVFDPISTFHGKGKNDKFIMGKTLNPFTEHSTAVLSRNKNLKNIKV